MFRIRRIQNAHFSSVPTRMRFFTCKKYDFLIMENPPSLSFLLPKLGKTHATLSVNHLQV
ncbi:hypothetical protein LBHA_01255 [Leptospira borgpetersenii serovar Hardjo]|nr:hypothetical protein LBHA_01255 [Leptospira borgpetersenii serovar Hardjo]